MMLLTRGPCAIPCRFGPISCWTWWTTCRPSVPKLFAAAQGAQEMSLKSPSFFAFAVRTASFRTHECKTVHSQLFPIAAAGEVTRKRHTMPNSAQPRHTNYWAPRTRKRHQQEQRPQRPSESSDPTPHAKGRTGDCPEPRKETSTRRNVTRGGHSNRWALLVLSPPQPFVTSSASQRVRTPTKVGSVGCGSRLHLAVTLHCLRDVDPLWSVPGPRPLPRVPM